MQMRRRDRTSPMPQDTKEIIQFEHIDHEQAALRAKFEENLAKQKAAYKKRARLHGAIGGEAQQKRAESISKYHGRQNDYRPAFLISTSNSGKNDRHPAKDSEPKCFSWLNFFL